MNLEDLEDTYLEVGAGMSSDTHDFLRHDCQQKKRRILYHHLPWGLRLQKKNRTWPPIINIPKNRHLPLESQGSVHWCYPEHLPVLPPILGRGMMRDAMGKLHRDMDQWSSSKWLLCPRMQKNPNFWSYVCQLNLLSFGGLQCTKCKWKPKL